MYFLHLFLFFKLCCVNLWTNHLRASFAQTYGLQDYMLNDEIIIGVGVRDTSSKDVDWIIQILYNTLIVIPFQGCDASNFVFKVF